MKRILIVGANSYIGMSFEKYIKSQEDYYTVDTLDLKDSQWCNYIFSGYDAFYYVAGIAHIKETNLNRDLYYHVNRDLAYDVAVKAKNSGVTQFIYLSSMSVYGKDEGIIDSSTKTDPKTHYGKSKEQAEEKLSSLADEGFFVSILRPPMVYGKDCKGNYRTLEKLALSIPFFPKIENKRSMIYIDNLNEYVRSIIDRCESGVFFPQNESYVCTYEMVKLIKKANDKKMISIIVPKIAVKVFGKISKKFRKAFGSLVYDNVENSRFNYNIVSFEESINNIYQK